MQRISRRSRILNSSKEELLKIISCSTNYSDLLAHYGLVNKGANFTVFSKKLAEFNIDIKHLKGKSIKRKLKPKNYDIDKIFVENSCEKTSLIKRVILRLNLIDYKCSLCNQNNMWNGKLLTLPLDHINGISNDNRLENLRFLCPNCHSQTDTFAGRNARKTMYPTIVTKKNRCQTCSILCWGKLCLPCSRLNSRKIKNRPTLDTLQIDVKNLGFVGTGKKYGVSDNCIRKWLIVKKC